MSPQQQEASLDEARERLGALLGLEQPVSERVATAAVGDPTYARNLLATREAPDLLEHLLAHPPEAPPEQSLPRLGGRLAEAMVRWGGTGFKVVDAERLQRRLAACAACPHRIEAPRHPKLHRWIAGGENPSVCGLCGCALARKARMTSERCPDEDPENPGFDRWGEPRPEAAERQDK